MEPAGAVAGVAGSDAVGTPRTLLLHDGAGQAPM